MNQILISLLVFTSGRLAFAGGGELDINIVSKPGVYFVPAERNETRYSVFDVSNVEIRETAGQVEIIYFVPQELTGAVNRMEFKGKRVKSGKLELTCKNGYMECPAAGDYSNCAVVYDNLKFDPAKRIEILRALSHSAEELAAREKVAYAFESDVNGQGVIEPAAQLRLFRIFSQGEPHGFLKVLGIHKTN